MKNGVLRSITAIFILLLSVQPALESAVLGDITDERAELISSKNELIEIRYAPTGSLISKISKVQFEVHNNGSRPATIGITDRVESLDVSTLKTLYGTPWPDGIETFGNLTKLIWDDVMIEADSSIEYQYLAESRKSNPLIVEETLQVNGNPADIIRMNDIYVVNANSSDILTFTITLKNVGQKLHTGTRAVTPPLECVVSIPLTLDYFSVMETDPKPNSTSVAAGKSVMTWFILLDETPRTLTASAKLIETSPWGEAPVDPISIQISSASTVIGLEKGFEYLDASIAMIESIKNVYREMSNATDQMYEAAKDVADAIAEESEESEKRVLNTLKVISSSLALHTGLLDDAEAYLQIAIDSLDAFMIDPRTIQFLFDNLDLALRLERARANMGNARATITKLQTGDPSTGTPGLSTLSYMATQLSFAFSEMFSGMEDIADGIYELAQGIQDMSDAARVAEDEMEASIRDLREEKKDLEEMTLVLQRLELPPYDVEIRDNVSQGDYEIEIGTESESENRWRITHATVNNTNGHPKMVYGLAIQLGPVRTPAEIPLVEININGTWQTFDDDLGQLGLAYDATENTMYLWPRTEVSVGASKDLLVDWTGRPINIIVESEGRPAIDYWADIAELHNGVLQESTVGRDTYSLVQPHILQTNLTQIDYPSPPPPNEWTATVGETLQTYGMQLLITTAIVIGIGYGIGSFFSRRSRARQVSDGEITVLAEGIEVAKLLDEIESIEEKLENVDKDRLEGKPEDMKGEKLRPPLLGLSVAGWVLAASGILVLAWVGWLTWQDVTFWSKDLALIFLGSRTGEAISLGIDMRVIHYFLLGLTLLISGTIGTIASRKRRQVISGIP